MFKLIGSMAVGAMLLAGCDSTALLSSGSPTPSAGAASPAADLRTHLNLLMGEHVFMVAKLSSAANGGRKTEFSSYAGLLATNGSDLTDLMTRSIGASGGHDFALVWTAGNTFAVDYVIAAATHSVAAKQATLTSEAGTYTTSLADFLISHARMASDVAAKQAADEAGGVRAVVDDQGSGDFAKAYADLHAAYQHGSSLGDAMGIAIAHQFPDRLPGDPTFNSVVHRATLPAHGKRCSSTLTPKPRTVPCAVATKSSDRSAVKTLGARQPLMLHFVGQQRCLALFQQRVGTPDIFRK